MRHIQLGGRRARSVASRVLFAKLHEMLDPEPHAAPLNMAIDEMLLRTASVPTLRIYRWEKPAVSLGYFGAMAEAEKLARGRELVRRWTGGGLVEHGDDLTYTLVVPRPHAFFRLSAPESYRQIHEALAAVLTRAGFAAEVAATASGERSAACFARPVCFDVVAHGQKIAGAAQRRTRWGLLHQGSVRAETPLAHLAPLLAAGFGTQIQRESLTPELEYSARALVEEKYGSDSWLRKY